MSLWTTASVHEEVGFPTKTQAFRVQIDFVISGANAFVLHEEAILMYHGLSGPQLDLSTLNIKGEIFGTLRRFVRLRDFT